MAKGWIGANDYGDVCEICGRKKAHFDIKTFHIIKLGCKLPFGKDHIDVCYQCSKKLPNEEWAGCGCGG